MQLSHFARPTTDNKPPPKDDGSEESPSTEIVILSLSDKDEDENFRSPPEHDELPPMDTFGCVGETREVDESGSVDLGNDSDNFGLKGSLEMDGKVIAACYQDEPGKFVGVWRMCLWYAWKNWGK